MVGDNTITTASKSFGLGLGGGNWNLAECGTGFTGLKRGVRPSSYRKRVTRGSLGEYLRVNRGTGGTGSVIVTLTASAVASLALAGACAALRGLPRPLLVPLSFLDGLPLFFGLEAMPHLQRKKIMLPNG